MPVAVSGQKLVGGGCIVENGVLVLSHAVRPAGKNFTVSDTGYGIDIESKLTIPKNGILEWKARGRAPFPGDLFTFDFGVVHILGGHFVSDDWLKQRTLDVAVGEEWVAPESTSDPLNVMEETPSYIQAALTDLKQGCLYNGFLYIMYNIESPSKVGEDLSVISKIDRVTHQNIPYPTRGSPPKYQFGLSIAQRQNLIYVANNNSIAILDLETAVWAKHTVPGFVAAKSGCLYHQKSTLIHSFGMIHQEFSPTTQFIDTTSWKLTHTHDPSPSPPPSYTPYMLISLAFFNVMLISIIIYKFVKWVRPPKILTSIIWAEPKFSYNVDMSLSTSSVFVQGANPSTITLPEYDYNKYTHQR